MDKGAQSQVYMFTDPRLSLPNTPEDDYTAPEVIKVGRNSYEMALYIRDELHILDPVKQAEKIAELTLAQIATLHLAATLDSPDVPQRLRRGFGNPRPTIIRPVRPPQGHFITNVAYTQIYGQPVKDFFGKLEKRGWDDKRCQDMGRLVIDKFVDSECTSCEIATFDPTYKLTENYIIDQELGLENSDFSEMETNRERVAHSIAIQEWEQMPSRSESAQLPPSLHEYFCERLSQELPRAIKRWGIRLDGGPVLPRGHHSLYDLETGRLWNNRPQTQRSNPTQIDPSIHPDVGRMAFDLILSSYSEFPITLS